MTQEVAHWYRPVQEDGTLPPRETLRIGNKKPRQTRPEPLTVSQLEQPASEYRRDTLRIKSARRRVEEAFEANADVG